MKTPLISPPRRVDSKSFRQGVCRSACVIAAGTATMALLPLAGCSGGSKPAASAPSARASGSQQAPLPPIDEGSALNVDGGRVAVRSPVGWMRSPRSKNYLVRYQPGTKETYPAIVVTGDAAPEEVAGVDGADQSKLIAAVAASGERFTRRPAAIRLGPHRGVSWSSPAMAKVDGLSEPIDRESFAVVIQGRLYTVEARAPKGKLDDKGRAAAMAVASALSPPVAEPTEPPATPAAPPETPPAEASAKTASEPAAAPAE